MAYNTFGYRCLMVHSFLQLIPYITQGSYIRDLESCLFSKNVESCMLGAQCEEFTSALKC